MGEQLAETDAISSVFVGTAQNPGHFEITMVRDALFVKWYAYISKQTTVAMKQMGGGAPFVVHNVDGYYELSGSGPVLVKVDRSLGEKCASLLENLQTVDLGESRPTEKLVALSSTPDTHGFPGSRFIVVPMASRFIVPLDMSRGDFTLVLWCPRLYWVGLYPGRIQKPYLAEYRAWRCERVTSIDTGGTAEFSKIDIAPYNRIGRTSYHCLWIERGRDAKWDSYQVCYRAVGAEEDTSVVLIAKKRDVFSTGLGSCQVAVDSGGRAHLGWEAENDKGLRRFFYMCVDSHKQQFSPVWELPASLGWENVKLVVGHDDRIRILWWDPHCRPRCISMVTASDNSMWEQRSYDLPASLCDRYISIPAATFDARGTLHVLLAVSADQRQTVSQDIYVVSLR